MRRFPLVFTAAISIVAAYLQRQETINFTPMHLFAIFAILIAWSEVGVHAFPVLAGLFKAVAALASVCAFGALMSFILPPHVWWAGYTLFIPTLMLYLREPLKALLCHFRQAPLPDWQFLCQLFRTEPNNELLPV